MLNHFTIDQAEANQIEAVTEQFCLHDLVVGTRAAEGRAHIHFQEPGLELGVNEDVKSVDLETRVFVFAAPDLLQDWLLCSQDCLDDHILDSVERV